MAGSSINRLRPKVDIQPSLISQDASVIVFGYGPVLPGSHPNSGRLDLYGKVNALAAGMLYQAHRPKNIIVTGGRTGREKRPSEAHLMAKIITSKFDVPESTVILEEQATNTILNLVYTANILDESRESFGELVFLAMGYHLRRIREICELVGLDGQYIAAEDIVSSRTRHHARVLKGYLHPSQGSYKKKLDEQEQFLAALQKMPEYWLPHMAEIEDPNRLQTILSAKRIQSFLKKNAIEVESTPVAELRYWLSSIERKIPSE